MWYILLRGQVHLFQANGNLMTVSRMVRYHYFKNGQTFMEKNLTTRVLFLNVFSFQLDTTSPTICQLFHAFQIIRFVKPSKIPFCFTFNLFVRLKTPTTQPFLGVWGLWRPGLENTMDSDSIRNPIHAFLPCNVRCVIWCIAIIKKDFFLLQMLPFLPDFVNQSIQ